MKNNKSALAACSVILIAACSAAIISSRNSSTPEEAPVSEQSTERYTLDESSYIQNQTVQELTGAEYDVKIAAKESFIVIARNQVCPVRTPLTTTVNDFIRQNDITIYGLMSEEFKESSLSDTVRYLPSAAIVINGEVIKYLDAESDDDFYAYQNADNFKTWLTNTIKLITN